MGNYFFNLHIRKSDSFEDALNAAVTAYFSEMGCTPADMGEADVAVTLCSPADSEWVSLYSEAFTYTDLQVLAPRLAQAVGTDVLSLGCVDSDYLSLHWLDPNGSRDLWLNIGETPELPKPRRSNTAAWKAVVRDFDGFRAASKQTYTSAEDFLRTAPKHLGLSFEQCTGNGAPAPVKTWYFSAPQRADAKPTRLSIFAPDTAPCKPGIQRTLAVQNQGDASRGICVLFVGDYIESDAVTIDSAEFYYVQRKNGPTTQFPITFEKRQWSNGQWVYCWEDPNFRIPPAVSDNLPPRVKQQKEFERTFGIRFTLRGNPRKFLDIAVVFAPLSNFVDGQCYWCVWAGYPSKRDYIDNKNQSNLESLAYGVPREIVDQAMIDPDQYDLD